MQHKVKVTVIDKKLYPELQAQYCADPDSGVCPCYQVGDEFIFERYGDADDFWHMGLNTLRQTANAAGNTAGNTDENTAGYTAGGSAFPHCSEAWDAISRYIYTGLQGGSIMRGWMNDERVMIACCSDGTRPVIFKIERMDYIAVYFDNNSDVNCEDQIREAFMQIHGVESVDIREKYAEVYLIENVEDDVLKQAAESRGACKVLRVE